MLEVKKNLKKVRLSDNIILLIGLLVLFTIFSVSSRDFITYTNISSMLKNLSVVGVLAIGLTPLMIGGGLDISFGSNLSFVTVIVALLYTNKGFNLWFAIIIGVAIGTCIGFINGILIESFNINSLILTLGVMSILQALSIFISDAKTILMLNDKLYFFATKSFLKIPYLFLVLLVLIIILWIITGYTKAGKTIQAVGVNPKVALLFGIKVKKVRIILYTFMGFFVGIASILIIAMTGVGTSYHGVNLPLPVLTAVMLGGFSLFGGGGTIRGTILGILIINVIFNGLSVLNVPSTLIQFCQGLLLIIVVSTYEVRRKRYS